MRALAHSPLQPTALPLVSWLLHGLLSPAPGPLLGSCSSTEVLAHGPGSQGASQLSVGLLDPTLNPTSALAVTDRTAIVLGQHGGWVAQEPIL